MSRARDRAVVDALLRSPEPSIRWKTRVHVLGESPRAKGIRELRMETLTPMLGLHAHARARKSAAAARAAKRASEVFLERRLFKKRSDGSVIRADFVALHYPLYWHYDFLGGLKAMARMGLIRDRRCRDALDLLEEKRLPDGGWPAEAKYYKHVSKGFDASAEHVDWGGTSKKRMNEWVTVDALAVLQAAGRSRA